MKTIIVDDNRDFANVLKKALESNSTPLSPIVEPEKSSQEIADKVIAAADGDTVVFINANLRCLNNNRQVQAGVEVLKSLRLSSPASDSKARTIRCVIYSFLRVEQLLRSEPSSFMICSPGVTFVQLPYDFNKFEPDQLSKVQVDVEDLAPFIRGEFRLPDARHDWANWWGARQMWSVYFLDQGPTDIEREDFVPATVNPQVRSALFLFNKSDVQEDAVRNLKAKARRRRSGIWSNLEYKPDEFKQPVLKIGLLDDEAQRIGRGEQATRSGWQRIYSRVLFNSDLQVVDLLSEMGGIEPDGLEDFIHIKLRDADLSEYACLLLDLRLQGETGHFREAAGLSGARMLDKFRKYWPGLPVIVTTASNKVWSYEALMRLGADAYWIKEGLDEQRPQEETIESYLRLLELVRIATGPKYQFMRRFSLEVKRLQDQSGMLWWERKRWHNYEKHDTEETNILKHTITDILNDGVLMLRSYLHQFEMKHGIEEETQESFWVSSVILKLGCILEAVHRWDEQEENQSRGLIGGYRDRRRNRYVTGRGDWFGWRLYGMRNKAAHYAGSKELTWEDLERFVGDLMSYLSYDPEEITLHFNLNRDFVNKEDIPYLRDMIDASAKYREVYNRTRGLPKNA